MKNNSLSLEKVLNLSLINQVDPSSVATQKMASSIDPTRALPSSSQGKIVEFSPAPRLQTPSIVDEKDFIKILMQAYMIVMEVAQHNAKFQQMLSENNEKTSKAILAMQEANFTVLKANIAKFQTEQAEALSKQSSSSLFSWIAMGVMAAVAIVTLQPELIVSTAMMTFMQTPAGQGMMSGLTKNLPSWAKVAVDIGVAIGMAIISCGVAGALTAGAESLCAGVAESASSAVSDGTEAASSTVTAIVEETAEDSETTVAQELATSTESKTTQAVQESSSKLSKIYEAGFKSGRIKFGNFYGQLFQSISMTGTWKDIAFPICKAFGMKDDDADETAGIIGGAMGLITTLGFSFGVSNASSALNESAIVKMFKNPAFSMEMKGLKLGLSPSGALKLASAGLQAGSASYKIEQGEITEDQGTVLNKISNSQAEMSLESSVQSFVSDFTKSAQRFEKQENKVEENLMQSLSQLSHIYHQNGVMV